MLFFAYGTLKRGQCREHVLRAAKFLGSAQTAPRWRLLDLGSYPGLVAGSLAVHGELYEISPSLLPTLDAIECVDDGLYERVDVAVRLDARVDGAPRQSDCTAMTYRYLGERRQGLHGLDRWPV